MGPELQLMLYSTPKDKRANRRTQKLMSSPNEKTAPAPAKSKWLFVALFTVALAASTFFAFKLFGEPAGDNGGGQRLLSLSPIAETIDQNNPVFKRIGLVAPIGCEEVLDYYKQNALEEVTPWGLGGWSRLGSRLEIFSAETAVDSAVATSDSQTASRDPSYSTTNIQVEGVDEADIVKTDGNYIYVLSGQEIKIIDIGQGGADNPPAVVAEVDLDFYAVDMLLSLKPDGQDGSSDTLIVVGYGGGSYQLRLVQVDIDDRQAPEVTADLTIDGSYVGVRLADNTVRLVMTSRPLGFDWETPAGSGLRAEARALEANKEIIRNSDLNNWVPAYQDNLKAGSEPDSLMDCSQMLVPNVFAGLNTLSIMTFNASEKLEVGSWRAVGLAADGQNIYATADSVYVATTEAVDDEDEPDVLADDFIVVPASDLKTVIHKFGLEQSEMETGPARPVYLASGEVAGTLLNQFSMDEYQGDLRVATTINSFNENRQENHVKVLRPNQGVFEEIGTVSGLGIDERIYAVRFMGPQAYVVTFRQIDPLYALDLSDPTDPKALGELKIPGFSTYLHPVGDNLLLGIGQEASLSGRTEGLQISLFDTSDPTNPRRVSQLVPQDILDLDEADEQSRARGYSPAEHDHRAFLFYEDQSFIPYDISWYARFSEDWGGEAGILVVEVEDRALTIANVLKAARQKDGDPTPPSREVYLRPIRTIVVDDLIYGITSDGELIIWQASGGELLHVLDY